MLFNRGFRICRRIADISNGWAVVVPRTRVVQKWKFSNSQNPHIFQTALTRSLIPAKLLGLGSMLTPHWNPSYPSVATPPLPRRQTRPPLRWGVMIRPNEGQNKWNWINLASASQKPTLIVLRLINFRNLHYPRVETQPQPCHQHHHLLHCGVRISKTMAKIS